MKYATLSHLMVDDQVLFLEKPKREDDPNSGFFVLPGGKLEENEKGDNLSGRLECVIRETFDETGLILINPVLVGIILFDNRERIFDNWPNPQDFIVYVYSAEKYSGELKSSSEGRAFWVKKNKISQLPKNAGDAKIYEWLEDGRNFSGVIKHKGKEIDQSGTWVDYF